MVCVFILYGANMGIDWDRDGTHDLLGKATTTLREWTFSWVEISLRNEDGSTYVTCKSWALLINKVELVFLLLKEWKLFL